VASVAFVIVPIIAAIRVVVTPLYVTRGNGDDGLTPMASTPHMQERGKALPDDRDAFAPTFVQPWRPRKSKKRTKRKIRAVPLATAIRGGCDDSTRKRPHF
jgi:hypothetical protein